MNEANPTPSVTVKKRNINSLVEYCIENKIDFTLRSRPTSDEFDVDFLISNTQKAIALGMCLKELKMELNGSDEGQVTMAFENALQFQLGTSN